MERTAAVLLAVFAIAACRIAPSNRSVVGHWKGEPIVPEGLDRNDPSLRFQINAASVSELQIFDNGKYRLDLMTRIEGVWSRDGSKILLRAKTVGGLPVNRPDMNGTIVRASDMVGDFQNGEIIFPSGKSSPVGVRFTRRDR
jgi:hypothetical protein